MAYTPNTWKDGDIITADKLNALEQGVGSVKDGVDGAKGDTGAAAPTITKVDIDATAGTVTATLSDKTTVSGTYTAPAVE
jgi:hypothetical protein